MKPVIIFINLLEQLKKFFIIAVDFLAVEFSYFVFLCKQIIYLHFLGKDERGCWGKPFQSDISFFE